MSEYVPTTDEVRLTYAAGDIGSGKPGDITFFGVESELRFDRWLAQHDLDVRAEVRESLAADLDRMSEQSHHTTEYSAGLSHAAALVRPKRRIESQETP